MACQLPPPHLGPAPGGLRPASVSPLHRSAARRDLRTPVWCAVPRSPSRYIARGQNSAMPMATRGRHGERECAPPGSVRRCLASWRPAFGRPQRSGTSSFPCRPFYCVAWAIQTHLLNVGSRGIANCMRRLELGENPSVRTLPAYMLTFVLATCQGRSFEIATIGEGGAQAFLARIKMCDLEVTAQLARL